MAASYYDATSINLSHIHLKLSELQELSIEEFQLNLFGSLLKDVERENRSFLSMFQEIKQAETEENDDDHEDEDEDYGFDVDGLPGGGAGEGWSKQVGGKSKCSSSRQVDDENDDDLGVADLLQANRNRQTKLICASSSWQLTYPRSWALK